MIIINHVILSDDIKEQYFHCHLDKCKGMCCVKGDQGAPLEAEELPILEQIYSKIEPYLSAKSKKTISEKGLFQFHEKDNDYTTTTNGNQEECVFAILTDEGIWKCAIEQAYFDQKISFRKPISCHLYPVRITRVQGMDLLNYERWDICNPACHYGKSLKVPVYRFVQEALIRKYGQEWFDKLLKECETER
ncbi:MAG: DUF3109 family protein [Bacteroidia bacterium]|nr:DUF3109 family protein [Bacteroidia bacterium]MDW8347095.1 DUF3109 family protein [Bacteroidia bacterium]